MMEVRGRAPAIQRMTSIEGFDMDAQWAAGRGPATVTDLRQRRTGGVGSTLSARVHRSGAWTVVEVQGEMDVQASRELADLVGHHATRVVLDLHGATFMDARGLGWMVDFQRRALDAGGCVRLAAPSASVQRILRLTGCDRLFQTFDSRFRAVSTPIDRAPIPAS